MKVYRYKLYSNAKRGELMDGIRIAVEGGFCTQEQLDAILQASLD